MSAISVMDGLQQLGFHSGCVVKGGEIILWEHDEPKPSIAECLKAAPLWEEKQQAEEDAKVATKVSAYEKLAKLGLTADEIEAITKGTSI